MRRQGATAVSRHGGLNATARRLGQRQAEVVAFVEMDVFPHARCNLRSVGCGGPPVAVKVFARVQTFGGRVTECTL